MMAGAAEHLASCGLNIQFGESSPSGHSHATWNVVCEAVEVRRRLGPQIDLFRAETRGVPRWKHVNALATLVAEEMYKTAVEVRAKLKAGGFLHERILKRYPPLLHRPSRISDPSAQQLAKEDYPRAARIRWIQNLPVFAFYGTNASEPYAFTYEQKQSMLQPSGENSFARVLDTARIYNPPTRAIASIHPEENHVRFIPVRESELDRLMEIELEYKSRFSRPHPQAGGEEFVDTTIGVWADTCRKVASHHINLLRVTNKTMHSEANTEAGVITLIGKQANGSEKKKELMGELVGLLGSLPIKQGRTLSATKPPTINPLSAETVFISRRMNAPEAKQLLELAEKWARYWGLEPKHVDHPVGELLTQTVTERIKRCSALFQIVQLDDAESEEFRNVPSAALTSRQHWIWYEYGVAAGANKHIARIVDRSRLSIDDWRVQGRGIGGDVVVAGFDLRRHSTWEEDFKEAMRKLAELVHGIDPRS